jgi:hypothetical protein
MAAAATAVSVTFALVWSMATLGHPGSPDVREYFVAAAKPPVEVVEVR